MVIVLLYASGSIVYPSLDPIEAVLAPKMPNVSLHNVSIFVLENYDCLEVPQATSEPQILVVFHVGFAVHTRGR